MTQEERKAADAANAEARRLAAEQLIAERHATFVRMQQASPLPLIEARQVLPGGLQLFPDEFLVTIGKDWGWSSQKLALTTHRLIYSRGRLARDQESLYLTDIRDIKFHKPLLGFGTLVVESAGGHSIEGLPAASNGRVIRDNLLQMVHFARQRSTPAATVQTPPEPQDRLDQLRKLGELRQSGILTEEEFQAEKKKLLES